MRKNLFSLILIILVIVISCGLLTGCGNNGNKSEKYNEALDLLQEGKSEEAYAILSSMKNYKASEEVLFYISAYRTLKENNQVESAANNLKDAINKNTNMTASVVDSVINSVKVVSKNAEKKILDLIVNASCNILTSDMKVTGARDSFSYSLDCSPYGLDLETCAKIIGMSSAELVAYAKNK